MDLIFAIVHFFKWLGFGRILRASVREQVENEGGRIVALHGIGLLLRSPFPEKLRQNAVYLWVETQYPSDHGAWLLVGTPDGTQEWFWKSFCGQTSPPGIRTPAAGMANHIYVLPYGVSVLLWLLSPVAVILAGFLSLRLFYG